MFSLLLSATAFAEDAAPAAVDSGTADSTSVVGGAVVTNQAILDALMNNQKQIDELKSEVAELKSKQTYKGRLTPKWLPVFELRIRPELDVNIASLGGYSMKNGARSYEQNKVFYVGERLRFGLIVEPVEGFRLVATIQDSRNWGEEKTFKTNEKGLDLWEGHLLFENIAGTGVTVRAGRFTMAFGSTMHVDKGNSSSYGQAYDGLWLTYYKPGIIKLDAFTTLVKTGLGPIFSADTKEDYESFSGVYLTTDHFVKYFDAELYGFYLDAAFANFTQRLGTVGGRVLFRPAKGLLLSAEAAGQFGSVSTWSSTPSVSGADVAGLQTVNHLAAVYLANVSYEMVDVRTKPRIGGFFLYATGDSTPFDRQSSAFKPTFGSTHSFLGYTDVLRVSGIWDIGPQFGFKPVDSLDVCMDYHFMFQTADGGLYQHFGTNGGNGTRNGAFTMDRGLLIPAGNSSFIGHELDLSVEWKPATWVNLGIAYAVLFPGGALDNAKIKGVVEGKGTDNTWQDEVTLGDGMAYRFLVWTTFSY